MPGESVVRRTVPLPSTELAAVVAALFRSRWVEIAKLVLRQFGGARAPR